MLRLLVARLTDPKRRREEDGFTLVELMVVIVIIGLLATVVIINVLPSQDKATPCARSCSATARAG